MSKFILSVITPVIGAVVCTTGAKTADSPPMLLVNDGNEIYGTVRIGPNGILGGPAGSTIHNYGKIEFMTNAQVRATDPVGGVDHPNTDANNVPKILIHANINTTFGVTEITSNKPNLSNIAKYYQINDYLSRTNDADVIDTGQGHSKAKLYGKNDEYANIKVKKHQTKVGTIFAKLKETTNPAWNSENNALVLGTRLNSKSPANKDSDFSRAQLSNQNTTKSTVLANEVAFFEGLETPAEDPCLILEANDTLTINAAIANAPHSGAARNLSQELTIQVSDNNGSLLTLAGDNSNFSNKDVTIEKMATDDAPGSVEFTNAEKSFFKNASTVNVKEGVKVRLTASADDKTIETCNINVSGSSTLFEIKRGKFVLPAAATITVTKGQET
jgi:hypothetical protein